MARTIKMLNSLLKGNTFGKGDEAGGKGIKYDATAKALLKKPYMTQKDLYDSATILSSTSLHKLDDLSAASLAALETQNEQLLNDFSAIYRRLVDEIVAATENIMNDMIRHLRVASELTTQPKLFRTLQQLQNLHQTLVLADHETSSAFINYLIELQRIKPKLIRVSGLRTSSDPSLKRIEQLAQLLDDLEGDKRNDIENLFHNLDDLGRGITIMSTVIGSSALDKKASQGAYFNAMKEYAKVCKDCATAIELIEELLPDNRASRAEVQRLRTLAVELHDTLLTRLNDNRTSLGDPVLTDGGGVPVPTLPANADLPAIENGFSAINNAL